MDRRVIAVRGIRSVRGSPQRKAKAAGKAFDAAGGPLAVAHLTRVRSPGQHLIPLIVYLSKSTNLLLYCFEFTS